MTETRLSYDRGATTPPLLDETIGKVLDRVALAHPDQDALIIPYQKVHWSWSELAERASQLAAALLGVGLERGDRVGIWAPNCAEWTLTQFATAKAGLVLVNINPAYRTFELEYALNKVQCKALILAPRLKSSNYVAMLNELIPELSTSTPGELRAEALSHLRTVIVLGEESSPGMYSFNEVSERSTNEDHARLRGTAGSLKPDDPINIQFTSGTTGAPKGATLSHRGILNNGFFVGEAIGLGLQDRLCVPVPLYHCFGMVMGNLGCLTHASTIVYPGESFDPGAVLETVSSERCTALYGVPTMFIAVLDHSEFSDFDLSSLRTGIMAGSPCPIEVMKRVIGEMHLSEMTIAYGMTETSPVSTQTDREDALERRVSSVGRVQPHVEIKIIDEQGATVPRNTPGEFCTRGYSVMVGYWDDKERTRDAIDAEGWMHTGDLATMDDQGYANIVGRLKDMVIRGGENLYPSEIEEFLYTHPKIQEAQVIGVPDEKYGEEICAWVRLGAGEKATEDDIRDFCKGRIAHNKIPRYVRFVDDFPTTVTGKIRKFEMRKTMIRELGLAEEKTA